MIIKITNKIKKLLKKVFIEKEIKIKKNDIYLVSFPKSGNTWMRFLLINYFFKKDHEKMMYSQLENYIPSIHKSSPKEINSLKGLRVIKSHFVNLKHPKIIYVIRDGRDAIVSYYYYQKDLRGFDKSFEEFYYSEFSSDAGTWDEHVRKALEYKSLYPDNIIFVKYEDLQTNIEATFSDVILFLEHNVDIDKLNTSIENSSFKELKEMQKSNGVKIGNKNVNFFRKGVSNQWKNYFTDELEKDFLDKSKDLLVQFNYNVD